MTCQIPCQSLGVSQSFHRLDFKCRTDLFSTISSSGVAPSADCQRIVAVLFNVNKVESLADMTSISPSRLRAAARGLRAK